MSIAVLALVGLLLVWVVRKYSKPRNFPPGPPWVPFFGSMPFLPKIGSPLSLSWKEMTERYGKIVGCMLGPFPTVVVYDYNLIKEIFNKDEFCGRQGTFAHMYRMLGKRQGLLFNEGPGWKSHRRFTLKNLRDLGFGKKSMEDNLCFEANQICDKMEATLGKPLEVKHVFNVAVLNILWKLVANRRYDLDDPMLLKCVSAIDASLQGKNISVITVMPWLRHIAPVRSGWVAYKWFSDELVGYVKDLMKERGGIKTAAKEESDGDFITAYSKHAVQSGDPEFNENALMSTIIDMFAAGSDTTANTLAWAVLYMILHPECHEKVQREIDDVLMGKEPVLDDKARYGKIVGCMLGPFPSVTVYDYNLIKEIFNKDEFCGRPGTFAHMYRMLGKRQGLLFNEGHSWKSHRRFSLKNLRDLGFGKKSMEDNLSFEANQICDKMEASQGKPLEVRHVFNVAVLNILWKLVANRRYDLDDPMLLKCVSAIDASVQGEKIMLITLMPWLRHIAPVRSGWVAYKKFSDELVGYVKDLMKQRGGIETAAKEESDGDFITAYSKHAVQSGDPDFNENALMATVIDMFAAGSDTTANTLSWAVLYMVLHPECQEKVQREIDDVLMGKEPVLDDKARLPYTEAVIAEIQRKSCIVPSGIPHVTLKDTTIGSYQIPKGTFVIGPLYFFMHDPDYWNEPESFKPDRFIKDGKFKKDERLTIFGIGKRYCLGEQLARNELFIIFIRIMQRLDITASPEHPPPVDKYITGFILSPETFHVVRAGLSCLNELTVHAVAMETWRAFHSQDGPDGSRNALGQVLFPSNVATRSTRSETAGVVSPHLPYAANTLVDNGIAMWNKFPALREASTRRMASSVANYGKIVGSMMGSFPVVAVYDYNLIKEIFNKDEFCGRPGTFAHMYRMLGKRQGLLFNEGHSWKSHRRFSLKNLRDLGFGKKSMEDN
eukprot:maker-scaffold1571_size35388-snap-gene-0.6 protein:Tk07363 transcript:maker-scaffold1571_size35388-snap-gene-0.6-mRNA-1 annotation:"probable cytochrome p450 303a1"